MDMRKGFTLIELLVTMGIAMVVMTLVVQIINPIETLAQGRDGRRISEIASIDEAITLALQQNPAIFEGSPKTVYLSLPAKDSNDSNCGSYALPPIANGWKYNCVPKDKLMKVDGTGWLPINFTSLAIRPLSVLPVDPINNKVKPTANSGGCSYYSYAPGWELEAQMESKKYATGGAQDVEGTDGGTADRVLEKGENLNFIPNEVENCQSIGIPPSWNGVNDSYCGGISSESGGSTYQYYTKWLIPGSGQVLLTKLWYWQIDQTLTSSESVHMAVYNGSSPYARISEIVSINGSGDESCSGLSCFPTPPKKGGAGWVYKDLLTPITINLGEVYIFGIGPGDASTNYTIGRVEFNGGYTCDAYLPPVGSFSSYLYGWSDLYNNATGFQADDKYGYIGVSYKLP